MKLKIKICTSKEEISKQESHLAGSIATLNGNADSLAKKLASPLIILLSVFQFQLN